MKDRKIYRTEIRLDYYTNKKLNAYCKKSRLTKSALIRKLIMSEPIREKPDEKFYNYLSVLNDVSDNLRIIAEKAEYLNEINKDGYEKELIKINQLITQLRLNYL